MAFHREKTITQLKELAAEFISERSNRTSLITVTDVFLSSDEENATVLISVFPETEEAEALSFCKRERPDLKLFVKEKSRLTHLPFFDFAIDQGEKNRRLIDDLSQKL